MDRVLVTGGAGFIGSSVIRQLISSENYIVGNVDALTYAGNLDSLQSVGNSERYVFFNIDICDYEAVQRVFYNFRPTKIMHLAAESHVDRSIDGPAQFVKTNVLGTFNLLEVSRKYWNQLSGMGKNVFRFHHVSTDEVYGDLCDTSSFFTESTPYSPSSPYSATKAGSDHLVRAWNRTYGLPTLITNCSNNYGPFHFPEKLIPHVIISALSGKPLPVYGDGRQVRDWLYVEDHARALELVLNKGSVGETYNIGGLNEKKNIDVVHMVCDLLEELAPNHKKGRFGKYQDLIEFVPDRPGHDLRYAIDPQKIQSELGWSPMESFDTGLSKTVSWYIDNFQWWERVLSGAYKLDRMGTDL